MIDSAPGDYTPLNAQLHFSFGQMAGDVVCANLAIIDDNVVEEDEESLTLTLSAVNPSVTTITASVATVLIRENDNDGKINTPCALLNHVHIEKCIILLVCKMLVA